MTIPINQIPETLDRLLRESKSGDLGIFHTEEENTMRRLFNWVRRVYVGLVTMWRYRG